MNNPDSTPTQKYKRYDEAFKHQAVEHWLLSGKSCRVIAAELGVTTPKACTNGSSSSKTI